MSVFLFFKVDHSNTSSKAAGRFPDVCGEPLCTAVPQAAAGGSCQMWFLRSLVSRVVAARFTSSAVGRSCSLNACARKWPGLGLLPT